MPVLAQDKPLETLRREVIDQLVQNYGHGHLSREAFEQRLDDAHDATDQAVLATLAADLETFHDPDYETWREHLLYADPEECISSRWCINIFSGTDSNHEDIVPATLKVVSIFGGADLDYSLARFSARQTHIKVLCVFGGSDIHVPEGVRIRTSVIPLFGGCSNRGEPANDPNAPVVIVSGLALFGGMAIGVKRTLRERLQGFADEIREMFS